MVIAVVGCWVPSQTQSLFALSRKNQTLMFFLGVSYLMDSFIKHFDRGFGQATAPTPSFLFHSFKGLGPGFRLGNTIKPISILFWGGFNHFLDRVWIRSHDPTPLPLSSQETFHHGHCRCHEIPVSHSCHSLH